MICLSTASLPANKSNPLTTFKDRMEIGDIP